MNRKALFGVVLVAVLVCFGILATGTSRASSGTPADQASDSDYGFYVAP